MLRLLSFLCLLAALAPSLAHAWWDDAWALRRQLTIDTTGSGAALSGPATNVPVLVRLHDGIFPFAKAGEGGKDLRFVTGDDGTVLKFHIEKYDPLFGMAFAWVQIPSIEPGTQMPLWLYYGNPQAESAGDPKGTYDPDTVLVYHFGERGAPPKDASQYANTALSPGLSADGAIIGDGLRLDGTTLVTLPNTPSLAVPAGGALTISAWVKMTAAQENAVLYGRRDGQAALLIGFDQGVPFVEVADGTGTTVRSAPGAPVSTGNWHHLAVVASGEEIVIYIDGAVNARLRASLPALATGAILGGDPAAASRVSAGAANGAPPAAAGTTPLPLAPSPAPAPGAATPDTSDAADAAAGGAADAPVAVGVPFVGEVDQFQISRVARSAAHVEALFASQGAGSAAKLVVVSAEEESSSWLTGYFAVILNAVTIDGWVVIAILMVMSVISWFVMFAKASFIGRQDRANREFRRVFDLIANDLGMLDRLSADELLTKRAKVSPGQLRKLHSSSLFRLLRTAGDELRHRAEVRARDPRGRMQGNSGLSAEAIAVIRARLDAGTVIEVKRLNNQIVLLTIAISGGPFLGLLGTVVGVMITFAAVAAAGEVNVNAIAPGIAAALVATVAGLAVAIPALFGYNYLLVKIKDIIGDMRVFVDEFVTRVSEYHSTNGASMTDPIAAE